MFQLALLLACQVPQTTIDETISRVRDPIVQEGLRAAVNKNLLPAATELIYPGHFTINADGGGYGNDTTWPGLDSWQMAGAYLLLGRTRIVTDYFDFVQASQRADGNIPFAIFPGDTQAGDTYLRGLRTPQDVFTYRPPIRNDLPPLSQEVRKWVGLFKHWELISNPLSTLGPICYVLTASEIYQATKDRDWLQLHMPSIDRTGQYLLSQITGNGLVQGSGFYTELPPRYGWDGVTQCYAVEAFHDLSRLAEAGGQKQTAKLYSVVANNVARAFRKQYWNQDHFVEYIHVKRGPIDTHGLTDTNWAAIAFGVADAAQSKVLWQKLISTKEFWPGNMPTLTASKPEKYEAWENEAVPFVVPPPTEDVAAMGRTWYLEALACKRMHARDRLIRSAQLVARMAKDGFWRERYIPTKDGGAMPARSEKYCEYPAVFARVVLENKNVFLK